ncbi:unnamed protein product [Amoebophrya sp. A25]|nr:unnamed protein product [Amoebophrya sp. A25]|eukprot:GSA25T00021502001.1
MHDQRAPQYIYNEYFCQTSYSNFREQETRHRPSSNYLNKSYRSNLACSEKFVLYISVVWLCYDCMIFVFL